ncbi:MAG: hypothetical protein ABJM11_03865 [Marinobacter sp.]|uniref:hypothetical protein n=1 Tax=Marinobacter sp. TaxID=50741 RepID=UPI003296C290
MNSATHALSISRRTVASRLANALSVTMQIPAGTELVWILGNGDECSNTSALASWVEKELCEMDFAEQQDPLIYLIARLERELLSIQEGGV